MLLQLPHRLLVPFVTLLHTFLFFRGTLPNLPLALRLQIVFFQRHLGTLGTTSCFYSNHPQAFFMIPLFAFGTSYHVAAIIRHAAYAMQFVGPTIRSFPFLLLVYDNHIGHESFHVHFLETLQQLKVHYTLVDHCLNWILIKRNHSRKSYGN